LYILYINRMGLLTSLMRNRTAKPATSAEDFFSSRVAVRFGEGAAGDSLPPGSSF
jgi:hypothetical protein